MVKTATARMDRFRNWRALTFVAFLVAAASVLIVLEMRRIQRIDKLSEELSFALGRDNHKWARHLIGLGADPNTREHPAETPPARGMWEMLRRVFLVQRKREGAGATPLILAASHGDLEFMRTLLKRGADVHAVDYMGRTALIGAARAPIRGPKGLNDTHIVERARRQPVREIMKILLEHGANVNATDVEGYSALYYVPYLQNRSCEQFLLQNGADARQTNRFSNTPLYSAVEEKRKGLARDLLDRGASPNDVNNRHQFTYLMVACSNGDLEMAALLLERGAKVNARDDGQMFGSALIAAARYASSPALVRLLLNHGANRSLKDCKGMTALDWATNDEVIQLLSGQTPSPAANTPPLN